MYFLLANLVRALRKRDLDRFEDVAIQILSLFEDISHGLVRKVHLLQRQVDKLMRLLGSVSDFKMTSKDHQKAFFINLFTKVLLVKKIYPVQTDMRLARAMESVQSYIFWGSDIFEAVEWNFKFHFHRALLRHIIGASCRLETARLTWGYKSLLMEKTDFILKASKNMPDLGNSLAKVLIARLHHEQYEGSVFDVHPDLFKVFNNELKGVPFEKTGNLVEDLMARLLCADAEAFDEYLAIRAIDLPFYIHRLFGLVGKACLGNDDRKFVPNEDFRNQVKGILTRDARTFTCFLLATHIRRYEFLGWVKRVELLDYSRLEWSTPFGVKLHQSIFSGQNPNMEHLVCRTPTQLAVETLRFCWDLTPEKFIGLPHDRLDIFLRAGALHNRTGSKTKWTEPYPNWLTVKDDDDDRAKTMKGLLVDKVYLKPMAKIVWGDDGVLDDAVRLKIIDFILDRVFCSLPSENRREPGSIRSIDHSPVFAYCRGLSSDGATQSLFDKDNSDRLFDALLLDAIEKTHIWNNRWYMLPDHLIFDLYFEGASEKWLFDMKGIYLKSVLKGTLKYPIKEYRQRMEMILEKTEEWWEEYRRS